VSAKGRPTGRRWKQTIGGNSGENKRCLNASINNLMACQQQPDPATRIRVLGTLVYIKKKEATVDILNSSESK